MTEDIVATAKSRFEQIHNEDPRRVEFAGTVQPAALVYHRRLSFWLSQLAPHPSTALQLATFCQHLRRWEIPRDSYPDGRLGYKHWRKALGQFHADQATSVLSEIGCNAATITRVQALLRKEGLNQDDEMQQLENAICLTFLELELAAFSTKHPRQKVIDILQKTWRKMSPQGHECARQMAGQLSAELQDLLSTALSA